MRQRMRLLNALHQKPSALADGCLLEAPNGNVGSSNVKLSQFHHKLIANGDVLRSLTPGWSAELATSSDAWPCECDLKTKVALEVVGSYRSRVVPRQSVHVMRVLTYRLTCCGCAFVALLKMP